MVKKAFQLRRSCGSLQFWLIVQQCKLLALIIFKYKVLNDHHDNVSWEFANKSTSIVQHNVPLCVSVCVSVPPFLDA